MTIILTSADFLVGTKRYKNSEGDSVALENKKT